MRRALLALLAVVAGAVAGVVPAAVPAAATPCAVGALHVAIVVDFGDGATVNSTCVGVNSGDNAAAALTARALMRGTKAPQFQNGLLCAIDGYPDLSTTTSAGQNSDGTYAYWSYWHGTNGTWTYSSVGATFRVQADVVEGWRYLPNGKDSGPLPPPGRSAVASDTCPPDVPTTGDPGGTTPATTAVPVSELGASAAGVTATTTKASAEATTTTTTLPGPSTSVPANASSSGEAARPVVTLAAGQGSSGSGSPLGVAVGVGLVGALGAGGVVAVRRRAAVGR